MEEVDKAISKYYDIKKILEFKKIVISDYKLINYGLQFTITKNNWLGLIRIYQNKKGNLKIDFSQLPEDANGKWIKNLIEGKDGIVIEDFVNNSNIDFGFPIIGTDESGKGDYFGPLVSAGAYVDNEIEKKLTHLGIRDSKKLSDKRNIELALKIKQICQGKFAIIEISPEKYNDLYEQFQKEKKNLNTLLAWGHAKAIEEILCSSECEKAIADQFADEKYILGKLQEKGKKIKLIQMHKAEQNIAVAAASILARARFLNKLSQLSNEYNIELPKGASDKVIKIGKVFINKNNQKELRKVAKIHFKITNKIIGN